MPKGEQLSELLGRCADGDQEALEALYRLSSPKLYAVCLALLRNEELAQDVLQDSYVRIWRRAGSYNPAKGKAMSWMTSIVRHRALDVLRSTSLQHEHGSDLLDELEVADASQDPVLLIDVSASTAALMECMDQLKEEHKRCIMMAYYYGYSHDELSTSLKKPLGTVKAWIRRGLKRIRECLD